VYQQPQKTAIIRTCVNGKQCASSLRQIFWHGAEVKELKITTLDGAYDCWSPEWAVLKRLNRSRCRLGCWLTGPNKPHNRCGPGSPCEKWHAVAILNLICQGQQAVDVFALLFARWQQRRGCSLSALLQLLSLVTGVWGPWRSGLGFFEPHAATQLIGRIAPPRPSPHPREVETTARGR